MLDMFQRKDMLLRTECIIRNGLHIAEVYTYLGDLVQEKPEDMAATFHHFDIDIIHVEEAIREILRMPFGTTLDADTLRAFEQAKEAVERKVPILEAWPSWYTSSRHPAHFAA